MASSREELLSIFHTTAIEITEKDLKSVSEGTVIGELGIDSLNMLEIIAAMEQELKIRIPDESLQGIQTVKDLIDRVQSRQNLA